MSVVQRYTLAAGTKAQLVVDLSALNSDPNRLGTSHLSGRFINSIFEIKSRISSDATYLNRFIAGQEMISQEQAFASLPIVSSKFNTGGQLDFDFTLKEDTLSLASIVHASRNSIPTLSVNNQVIAEVQKLDWNANSSMSGVSSPSNLNEAMNFKLALHSVANSQMPVKLGEGTIEITADAGGRIAWGMYRSIPGPLSFTLDSNGRQIVDASPAPALYSKPYSIKNLGTKPVIFSGTGSYAGSMTAAANSNACVSIERDWIAYTAPSSATFPHRMNPMVQWLDQDYTTVRSVSACD